MTAAQAVQAAETPVARVLVCDDSATVRGVIARILEADPAIRVVARAVDGQAALDALALHDIEMPIMDGLTALPLLLAAQPGLAVIMASSLTERGAATTMRALRLGAADYVPKPQAGAEAEFGAELVAKILGLARLRRPASICRSHHKA